MKWELRCTDDIHWFLKKSRNFYIYLLKKWLVVFNPWLGKILTYRFQQFGLSIFYPAMDLIATPFGLQFISCHSSRRETIEIYSAFFSPSFSTWRFHNMKVSFGSDLEWMLIWERILQYDLLKGFNICSLVLDQRWWNTRCGDSWWQTAGMPLVVTLLLAAHQTIHRGTGVEGLPWRPLLRYITCERRKMDARKESRFRAYGALRVCLGVLLLCGER